MVYANGKKSLTFQGYPVLGSTVLFELSKSFLHLYLEIYRDKINFPPHHNGSKMKNNLKNTAKDLSTVFVFFFISLSHKGW